MCKKLSSAILVGLLTCRKAAVVTGLLALTACSTTKVVQDKPPAELLRNCPAVVEELTTNGSLALTILSYRDALAKCNIDKESLREWVK